MVGRALSRVRTEDGILPARALIWPVGLALLAVLVIVAALTIRLADIQNREALGVQTGVVEEVLAKRSYALAQIAVSHAFWTDAHDAVLRRDRDWLGYELGSYLTDLTEANVAVVYGPDGAPLVIEGSADFVPDHDSFVWAEAVVALREAAVERARAAGPFEQPGTSTAFIRVGATVYFAAASAIVPDKPGDNAAALRPGVLLLADAIEADVLAGFGERLSLKTPHVDVRISHDHDASVPLRGADGAILGHLSWTPPAPARALRDTLIAVGVLTVVVLVIAAALIFRSFDAAARRAHEVSVRTAIAESASDAKNAFIANMSHELRTPLNAIVGFSELLRSEAFDPLGSAQYRDYAGHIEQGGRRMLDLVHDLLTVTKLESGEYMVHPESRALAPFLAQVVGQLSELAAARAVRVQLSAVMPHAQVRIDEDALAHALRAILANAVAFTPEHGTVHLAVSDGKDCWTIWVQDQGPGMSAELIERLGKPFTQAESAFARSHGGAGLGIAIAGRIVALHGGTLSADNPPGGGARVTIRLPAAPAIPQTEPRAAAA